MFDFQKVYGDIGKDFIEAHHIVPVSELNDESVVLTPVSGALVHNAGSVLVVLNAALLYDRKFD